MSTDAPDTIGKYLALAIAFYSGDSAQFSSMVCVDEIDTNAAWADTNEWRSDTLRLFAHGDSLWISADTTGLARTADSADYKAAGFATVNVDTATLVTDIIASIPFDTTGLARTADSADYKAAGFATVNVDTAALHSGIVADIETHGDLYWTTSTVSDTAWLKTHYSNFMATTTIASNVDAIAGAVEESLWAVRTGFMLPPESLWVVFDSLMDILDSTFFSVSAGSVYAHGGWVDAIEAIYVEGSDTLVVTISRAGADIIDSTLSDNHGDSLWTPYATGGYQIDLYAYSSEDSSVIPSLLFALYASGELGGTPLLSGFTSADSGLVRFGLTAGTFDFRGVKTGYWSSDTSITIASDTSIAFYIAPTTWPVAPDTNYCMVVFDAVDIGPTVPAGEKVKIHIYSYPQYMDIAGIAIRDAIATYDSTGRASIALIRGAQIEVTIAALGFTGTGTVPDTSAIGWRAQDPSNPTKKWLRNK
jgi:hypothetical protein